MDEYVSAHVDASDDDDVAAYVPPPVIEPRRRRMLPLVLFLLTCLSTFFTGSAWSEFDPVTRDYVNHFVWSDGLAYMLAVMAILTAHEMGHFVQAVRHRVPASLPYFIPMPITFVGTMGAVIGMHGSRADRRQLFDIGITGPLAGLVVALPIAWYGVMVAVPHQGPPPDGIACDPLLLQLLIQYLRPEVGSEPLFAWNPYYMAAWVGMLITGLNMMPLSQLDGGHISYALFGRRAHLIARLLVMAIVLFMVYQEEYGWMVMLAVIMFIGVDHPPTSNDRAPLGPLRIALGITSLAIPILCLAPVPLRVVE